MKKPNSESATESLYDVAIIGGGIIGASLLYVLAKYTDIERVVLVEKEKEAGLINSNSRNNSQTLHMGDIETNYTIEKALSVKEGALMMVRYAEGLAQEERDRVLFKYPKMALAVGVSEVAELEQRFKEFAPAYPWLKRYTRQDIARLEPKVMEGRDPNEPILALGTQVGYAANFGAFARSFIEEARKANDKRVEVHFLERVRRIEKENEGFALFTDKRSLRAKVLVVAAGSHSLLYAKQLGCGKGFSIIPIGGNFYYTPQVLNGKVYTMQNKQLPFSAVHGDPDVSVPGKTRFGPTAKFSPVLEGGSFKTTLDYIKSAGLDYEAVMSFICVLRNPVMSRYLIKNMLYDLPFIGKRLYLKTVQKIVPTVRLNDLSFARGIGGMRMQNVDKAKRAILFGESKIVDDNAIFNMTPSPGASMALQNAMRDATLVAKFLNTPFDRARFRKDFIE